MTKQGRLAILVISSFLLSSCISGMWTSASMVYDRHNVYKKITDYQLGSTSVQALYVDNKFKAPDCVIDVTVFKENILLAGHLPSAELKEEAQARVISVIKNKRIYNELRISNQKNNTLQDSWITTKIRSKILADSSIDPNTFKITTTDNIVYILGEMQAEQAQKVIDIARNVSGVEKVVKIIQYYKYTHFNG